MASFLDSTIRKEVAKGFKGQLLPGVLLREVPVSVNSSGDPVPSASPLIYSVQGIRENFRADFAATAGIPMTDVRILLILGLIKPTTTPVKDDKIRIRGEDGTQKWHQVRAVLTVDPANAHAVLQCFEIPTPDGAP
jgi:hypothetical protein